MSGRSIILCALLLAPAALFAPSAWPYNDTVHFFTTATIMGYISPSVTDQQMRVVAFCAQLPDETLKLDAMKQYQNLRSTAGFATYLKWARADFGSDAMSEVIAASPPVREMITVQQLLHGLNGGSGIVTLTTADAILDELADRVEWGTDAPGKFADLCSVGLAVHLLGDAIAHRRLGSGDIEAVGEMYPTGWGHASDLKRPDRILTSATKLTGWQRYNEEIGESLEESVIELAKFKALTAKLEAASDKWFGKNEAVREAIVAEVGTWATGSSWLPSDHSNQACQVYLNEAFPSLVAEGCAPSCRVVWEIYSALAIQKFADNERYPALSQAEYVAPDLPGEPANCPAG
jgi:hypothetical protein